MSMDDNLNAFSVKNKDMKDLDEIDLFKDVNTNVNHSNFENRGEFETNTNVKSSNSSTPFNNDISLNKKSNINPFTFKEEDVDLNSYSKSKTKETSGESNIDLFGELNNKNKDNKNVEKDEKIHKAIKESVKESNKKVVMNAFGKKVLPTAKTNAFDDFEEKKDEVVTNNNHIISDKKLKEVRKAKLNNMDNHVKTSLGLTDTTDKKEVKKSKRLVKSTKKSYSVFTKQVWLIIHKCEEITNVISLDSASNTIIGELPIMEFKEVLFDTTSNKLSKEDKKSIRINLVPVIRDLAYMAGIARYKTVKILDFSEIQYLPDLINLIIRCSTEEGKDSELLKHFEQLFVILNELENIYGLNKALELATYRYMRLMYVLLVYGAKGDLAILSDFLALQIQLI